MQTEVKMGDKIKTILKKLSIPALLSGILMAIIALSTGATGGKDEEASVDSERLYSGIPRAILNVDEKPVDNPRIESFGRMVLVSARMQSSGEE